jgi:uncharacterized protein (TIGR03435 family)
MLSLANTLVRLVGRPVVDQTGLTGRYDFDLEYLRDESTASEFGVSLFTSLQRVGLRLEARKLPLDAIVVDSAEKTPVEN